MDLLEFQSLIGIEVGGAEKELTRVRPDVIFSIPDRDLLLTWLWQSLPMSNSSTYKKKRLINSESFINFIVTSSQP